MSAATTPDLFTIIGVSDFLQPAAAARKPSRSTGNKSDKDIFVADLERQIALVSKWSQEYPTLIDGTATLADGKSKQKIPSGFPSSSGRGQRVTWYRIDKDGRWVLNLFLGNLLIFETPFLIVGGWDGLNEALLEILTAAKRGKFDSRLAQVRKESRERREATKAAKAAKTGNPPAEAKAA